MPRIRFAILVCAAAGVVSASFYLLAMSVAGIHGFGGLMAWIHESAPDSKDAKALRMVSGMARSVYELGHDSVWLKWYRFHDPYAKVGIGELARESLSRIALFYASLLGLVILLWHSSFGKRLLLFIAVAALPHIGVGLTYESSGVERYVGFLPALFLGFGYAIGSAELSLDQAAAGSDFMLPPYSVQLAIRLRAQYRQHRTEGAGTAASFVIACSRGSHFCD